MYDWVDVFDFHILALKQESQGVFYNILHVSYSGDNYFRFESKFWNFLIRFLQIDSPYPKTFKTISKRTSSWYLTDLFTHLVSIFSWWNFIHSWGKLKPQVFILDPWKHLRKKPQIFQPKEELCSKRAKLVLLRNDDMT